MTITKTQKGERTLYTIDAAGGSLGRVASEAASVLLGKKSAQYLQNEVMPVEVEIVNASKLVMTEKRIKGKEYTRYTGYPGGLRITSLANLLMKKGVGEAIRKAVDGMIPRNKLRKERMKRLTITD
jgi:large subunit ribosomal protein L13